MSSCVSETGLPENTSDANFKLCMVIKIWCNVDLSGDEVFIEGASRLDNRFTVFVALPFASNRRIVILDTDSILWIPSLY
jgi:hypothetical protein